MRTGFWSEIGDLHCYHVLRDPAAMQTGPLFEICDQYVTFQKLFLVFSMRLWP